MKKKKKSLKSVLNKQTISNLSEDDLKKIYGGLYTETCSCSSYTTKEVTKIPTVQMTAGCTF